MFKDKIALLIRRIIGGYSNHIGKLENEQNKLIDEFVLKLEEKKKENLRREIDK